NMRIYIRFFNESASILVKLMDLPVALDELSVQNVAPILYGTVIGYLRPYIILSWGVIISNKVLQKRYQLETKLYLGWIDAYHIRKLMAQSPYAVATFVKQLSSVHKLANTEADTEAHPPPAPVACVKQLHSMKQLTGSVIRDSPV